MKTSIILLAFLITEITSVLNAQCTYNSGNRIYEATCYKTLSPFEDNCIEFGCELSIVKNGKSGFLILKTSEMIDKYKGKVYIYLDDNTIITLLNTNKQWRVNGVLHGQFTLTENEIIKLKNSNIRAIRFWTCSSSEFSSLCEDAKEYYNPPCTNFFLKKINVRIDFPKMISDLFD